MKSGNSRESDALARLCEGLIESGWLVCLIVVPLYLDLLSTSVFEPGKLALLRTVTAAMAAAWAVLLVCRFDGVVALATGLRSFLGTPLVAPVLLLTASSFLSAALSVEPRSSWFGSHIRSQGALTTLAFSLFFLAALHCLRRTSQWRRSLFAVVLTSVPVSLYGIAQFLGLDPLPWAKIFESGWGLRITSTLGNPIFLGSYLLAPIFMGLGWLLSSLVPAGDGLSPKPRPRTALLLTLGAVLLLDLGALGLTSSRGPLLGLLAGGGLLAMIFALRLGLSAPPHRAGLAKRITTVLTWSVLVGTLSLTALFAVQARGALHEFEGHRQPARLSLSRTIVVRILIWDAAAKLMASSEPLRYSDGTVDGLARFRPWIGFGPETSSMALLRYYPAGLSRFGDRRSLPDRAHNLILQRWVTQGWIGVAALLFFFISLLGHGFRWSGLAPTRRHRIRLAATLTAGTLAGAGLSLVSHPWMLGIGASAGMVSGVCAYVLWLCRQARDSVPMPGFKVDWLMPALLAALAAHFVELQSGIETASAQVLFWFLAAAAVALGEGRLAPTPTANDAARAQQRLRERADILNHGLMITLAMVTLGFDFFANWGSSMAAKGVGDPTQGAMSHSLFSFASLMLILLASWLVGWLLVASGRAPSVRLRGRYELWKPGAAAALGSLLLFYLFLSIQDILVNRPPVWLPAAARDGWAPFAVYWPVMFVFLVAVAWVARLELPRSMTAATRFAPLLAAAAFILVARVGQAESRRVEGDVLYKRALAAASVGDFQLSQRIFDDLIKSRLPAEWLYRMAKTDTNFEQALLLTPIDREELFKEMETDLLRAQRLRRLDVAPLEGLARIATLRAELEHAGQSRSQRLEEAKERWRQAVALAPGIGYLRYGLAMASLRLGKTEEAGQDLLRAIQLDPGLEEARQALQTLSGDSDRENGAPNGRARRP